MEIERTIHVEKKNDFELKTAFEKVRSVFSLMIQMEIISNEKEQLKTIIFWRNARTLFGRDKRGSFNRKKRRNEKKLSYRC